MQGASALQDMLAGLGEPGMKPLVVWMPVLATDVGPPSSRVLGLIHDGRAAQFWDPDRALSDAVLETARAHRDRLPPEFEMPEVAWDILLVYPRDARWTDRLPFPEWYGFPVVDAASEAARAIRQMK